MDRATCTAMASLSSPASTRPARRRSASTSASVSALACPMSGEAHGSPEPGGQLHGDAGAAGGLERGVTALGAQDELFEPQGQRVIAGVGGVGVHPAVPTSAGARVVDGHACCPSDLPRSGIDRPQLYGRCAPAHSVGFGRRAPSRHRIRDPPPPPGTPPVCTHPRPPPPPPTADPALPRAPKHDRTETRTPTRRRTPTRPARGPNPHGHTPPHGGTGRSHPRPDGAGPRTAPQSRTAGRGRVGGVRPQRLARQRRPPLKRPIPRRSEDGHPPARTPPWRYAHPHPPAAAPQARPPQPPNAPQAPQHPIRLKRRRHPRHRHPHPSHPRTPPGSSAAGTRTRRPPTQAPQPHAGRKCTMSPAPPAPAPLPP